MVWLPGFRTGFRTATEAVNRMHRVSRGARRRPSRQHILAMSDIVESIGPDDYIEILVAAALDDLEEGDLDVESTLRTLARAMWEAGRRYERDRPAGSP